MYTDICNLMADLQVLHCECGIVVLAAYGTWTVATQHPQQGLTSCWHSAGRQTAARVLLGCSWGVFLWDWYVCTMPYVSNSNRIYFHCLSIQSLVGVDYAAGQQLGHGVLLWHCQGVASSAIAIHLLLLDALSVNVSLPGQGAPSDLQVRPKHCQQVPYGT